VVVSFGVAIAVGFVGVMGLSRRRTKLARRDGCLILSTAFRDRVLLSGDDRGRVVNVEVAWNNTSRRRSRLWLLINEKGRTATGLNRDAWDESRLESLREGLGLPLDVDETPKGPAEMREVYPGSIPWWAVHPAWASLLMIMVLAVIALIFQSLLN
jgi:hypothetical protein